MSDTEDGDKTAGLSPEAAQVIVLQQVVERLDRVANAIHKLRHTIEAGQRLSGPMPDVSGD